MGSACSVERQGSTKLFEGIHRLGRRHDVSGVQRLDIASSQCSRLIEQIQILSHARASSQKADECSDCDQLTNDSFCVSHKIA